MQSKQKLDDLSLQVSVFDTINSAGGYSRRVRRLGEFHPQLAKIKSPDAQDIDDPLYGNVGGAAEKACSLPHARTFTACRWLHASGKFCVQGLSGACCLLWLKQLLPHMAQEAVEQTLKTIQEACGGLVSFLEDLSSSSSSNGTLRNRLGAAVKQFEDVDWLVPPMLQTRS